MRKHAIVEVSSEGSLGLDAPGSTHKIERVRPSRCGETHESRVVSVGCCKGSSVLVPDPGVRCWLSGNDGDKVVSQLSLVAQREEQSILYQRSPDVPSNLIPAVVRLHVFE